MIRTLTNEDALSFFDAIAPIVHRDLDMSIAWMQSRYDKSGPGGDGADYVNCPLDETQYRAFIAALLEGEKTEFKEWEKSTPYFEGCLPIEVMASRGAETLSFGPMKPVGLCDPRVGRRPHAVVQLRQDNALGTLWNMVGFQTKLKHGEQTRIFRMIPGWRMPSFARLGGLHRNTFINSPRLLDGAIAAESAAVGALRGPDHRRRRLCRKRGHRPFGGPLRGGARQVLRRPTTALGALARAYHRRRGCENLPADERQFRSVPGLSACGKIRGRDRKKAMSQRALADLEKWLSTRKLAAE